MDFFTIVAVAIGLSFDTFAVSLSFGVVHNRILFREALKIAFILAFFQAGMLIAGFFLGSFISEAIKTADHWIALALLSLLGIRMIIEGSKTEKGDKMIDYTKIAVLLAAGLGTSIDALAVGISFALLNVKIGLSAIIIGAVTFLASMTAIRLGKSAAKKLGNNIEILGGILLIAIGIKIFFDHTMGAL
ncbi:MAG: manganese efflux pump [Bacteroidales bacterium]|nr:manganese efflux pump [Bacteroidales bacterium]